MRSRSLDILRGVAILLVLWHHAPWPEGSPARLFIWGWTGVDLFFVLSGYLVTGLLMVEQKARGTVDIGRFLIRRGLKIWPQYYLLLAVSVIVGLWAGRPYPLADVLGQIFYLQNYIANDYWPHTWSLAVEEHFYLALALCFALYRALARDHRGSGWIPGLFLVVLVAAMYGRSRVAGTFAAEGPLLLTHFATHLRMDSLAFGSLLAYGWHGRPGWQQVVCSRGGRVLLLAAAAALCALFVMLDARQADHGYALRYTLLSMIAVALIGYALGIERPPRWTRALSLLGYHSYSIYLWHVPMSHWIERSMQRAGLEVGGYGAVLVYGVTTIGWGLLMSRMIERPILRWRDRCWPSRSGAGVMNRYASQPLSF